MPAKGARMSEAHRQKIRDAKTREYADPEARARQSERLKIATDSHGQVGTGVYSTWSAMKQRCLNPRHKDYPRYGGRGIAIAPKWLDFRRFYADMGDRPEGRTLDRIDPNKGYVPGNCRWATHREQRMNQERMQPRA